MVGNSDWKRGCAAPDSRLAALLDGKLPPAERQLLQKHLHFCARCGADLAQQRAAQAALRRTAATLIPSSAFQARVQNRLSLETPLRSTRRWLVLLGGLAAVVAVLACTSLLLWVQRGPSTTLLGRAALAHEQETLGEAPVSFASSDPTAVAAWARGQTGVPIDVPNLDIAQYHLLGARLDPSINPKAVALVYQGTEGRMTCTILPASSSVWTHLPIRAPSIQVQEIDGTEVASLGDGAATYIMVAHLDPSSLLQLARLVR